MSAREKSSKRQKISEASKDQTPMSRREAVKGEKETHESYASMRCTLAALKNAVFMMPDRLKERVKELGFS
jgi:hypothetical protein